MIKCSIYQFQRSLDRENRETACKGESISIKKNADTFCTQTAVWLYIEYEFFWWKNLTDLAFDTAVGARPCTTPPWNIKSKCSWRWRSQGRRSLLKRNQYIRTASMATYTKVQASKNPQDSARIHIRERNWLRPRATDKEKNKKKMRNYENEENRRPLREKIKLQRRKIR